VALLAQQAGICTCVNREGVLGTGRQETDCQASAPADAASSAADRGLMYVGRVVCGREGRADDD
jgi:hypothetical protein